MPGWSSVYCAECGDEIRVHQDWENPPRICKSCKAEKAAQWYEKSCERCGSAMRVHRDWDHPPKYCPACKAALAAEWHDKPCERCGDVIKVHRDWDHPPRFCKSCKALNDAEWYEVHCQRCGTTIRARRDWDKPPKFCKSCKAIKDAEWRDSTCEHCGTAMRVMKDWEHPPKFCKSCVEGHPNKEVPCRLCGKPLLIRTATQLKCAKNGWELPSVCQECKDDYLLIKGAVGSLRAQIPFALETTIECRGWLRTDKVAVVRSKKTKEVVAEVRMDEKGLFFVERVATTYVQDLSRPKPLFRGRPFDVATHETRDEEKGILFPERVANTYVEDPDASKPLFGPKKKTLHTHETRNIDEGILFPKHLTETKSVRDLSAPKIKTQTEEKGIFSRIRFWATDKTKKR